MWRSGLLLLRHEPALTRRFVVYFCAAAYTCFNPERNGNWNSTCLSAPFLSGTISKAAGEKSRDASLFGSVHRRGIWMNPTLSPPIQAGAGARCSNRNRATSRVDCPANPLPVGMRHAGRKEHGMGKGFESRLRRFGDTYGDTFSPISMRFHAAPCASSILLKVLQQNGLCT